MIKEDSRDQRNEKENTAVYFLNRGEYKRAIECIKEILQYENNNPVHYYQLAVCYQRLGMRQEARAAYKKFIRYGQEQITQAENFLQSMPGEWTLADARQAFETTPQQRVIPWFQAQGDKTLRLDYDLNQESLVFDLGGYQGDWTANIFARYGCHIHVFEPVTEYAEQIKQKFIPFEKVHVHPFGLGKNSRKVMLNVDQDSSSMYTQGEQSREATLVRADDFIKGSGISSIDLMKINIEGGEYDLLEHFIEMNQISIIKNLQVQFHDFIPNAVERMFTIQKKLAETHCITYQFPFVWENWKIK